MNQNNNYEDIFSKPVIIPTPQDLTTNQMEEEANNLLENNTQEVKEEPVKTPELRPEVAQMEVLINLLQKQVSQSSQEQPKNTADNYVEKEQDNVIKPIDQNLKKRDLLITNNPKSSFSEAIKTIRTNLQFAAVDKEIKTILVTSPEPADGKSLISSNLAGAFAQDDKKVLIIDCDLRKGRQAEIFSDKKINNGYSNLIYNYNNLNDFNINNYIIKTDYSNIDLIAKGSTPPNPIELLSSPKNKEIITKLKEIYDIIILDCPPVLGLSDTLIMTKYSDANIVVISKGKTKLELLAEVKKNFEKVNSSITGVVLNKAKQKHNSYYGYYGE